MPVPALKEHIVFVTVVLSEQQRLICRGKVLKDDQLLSACHVEEGHTLHLVVRQPVPPSSDGSPNHSENEPGSGTIREVFPTPASLAEALLSARQMLIKQAGECLQQLARQLEEQGNVTDPSTRLSTQSNAWRTGLLLQNLGLLSLELGRTTMTLRLGQTPQQYAYCSNMQRHVTFS